MPKPRKKVRILSLDGGGIRGVIPATVLQYVETELRKRTGNNNARIADFFDMVVGTSTGGILGCLYLTPAISGLASSRYTATQALEFYTQNGFDIFNKSKKRDWFGTRQLFDAARFDPTTLEKLFVDKFGDLKLHQLLKPCVITSYNMQDGSSVFFNSFESDNHKPVREFYVRDVTRSTSAAPTYFPPAKIKNLITAEEMMNIDGGVFANDPAICAYAEARTTNFKHLGITNPGAEEMLLLSIGTGSMPLDLKDVKNSQKWGVISWAKNTPDIMMDGGLETVSYQVNKMFSAVKDEPIYLNYKRVNVPGCLRLPQDNSTFKPTYNSDMSDASPENIEKLQIAGEEAIKDANVKRINQLTLSEIIDELISIDQLIKS